MNQSSNSKRIQPPKKVSYDDWFEITSDNFYGAMWVSLDFLVRVDVITTQERMLLDQEGFPYVLVAVPKQEYISEDSETKSRVILELKNDKTELTKEIEITMTEAAHNYELFLLHVYTYHQKNGRGDAFEFLGDSDFIQVSTSEIGHNLLFLATKYRFLEKLLEGTGWYFQKMFLHRLATTYDQPDESLMFARAEYVEAYFKHETNVVKKYALAKHILQKNQYHQPSLNVCLEYLTSFNNQEPEALELFYEDHYKSFASQGSISGLATKSFEYFLRNKHYDWCKKILDTPDEINTGWHAGPYVKTYLNGALKYHQNNHQESVRLFTEVVAATRDHDLLLGCYFYLILNYLNLNDTTGLQNTLSLAYRELSASSEIFIFQFSFPKQGVFLSELTSLTKTNPQNRNILTPLITYLTFVFQGNLEPPLHITQQITEDIASQLEVIETNTKPNPFETYVASAAAFIAGDFDRSMRHRIHYIIQNGNLDLEVEISQCSDEFLFNYIKILKEKFRTSGRDPEMLEIDYVMRQLPNDVRSLFKAKEYSLISELYIAFEDSIDSQGGLPKYMQNEYSTDVGSVLFEIAYSLKHTGHHEKAKWVYENIEDPSSAVLNNLALIYEEQGDLGIAKKLLQQAFNLSEGKDEVISRNKDRIEKGRVSYDNKPTQKDNSGLKWPDVEIKFTGDNTVEIKKGKKITKGDYETFGFKKPDDKSWIILRSLSVKYSTLSKTRSPIIIDSNILASQSEFRRSSNPVNLVETYKSKLSKALCTYFGIDTEPIPHRGPQGYVPAFTLVPVRVLREEDIYGIAATNLLD